MHAKFSGFGACAKNVIFPYVRRGNPVVSVSFRGGPKGKIWIEVVVEKLLGSKFIFQQGSLTEWKISIFRELDFGGEVGSTCCSIEWWF